MSQETEPNQAFQVKVASTGDVYDVGPEETIVEVLEAHGIEIPVSCTHGLCGTCLTTVLEGTPDHRDFYLTSEEREKGDLITPCCSRSKSDLLVLDI